MKVLIVTSEWPRFDGDLAGIHIINQISQLENEGVIVEVFHFWGRKHPLRYVNAIFNSASTT